MTSNVLRNPVSPHRRTHRVPRLACAAALAVTALAFPASALAHTGAAAVSCSGADLTYTSFAAGANTVSYRVTVDGATAAQGTTALGTNGGTAGTVHVPLSLSGTHVVEAFEWWGPTGVQDRNTRPADSPALASKTLDCPVAPPATTPPVTVTPSVVAPPAATPLPAVTPSAPLASGSVPAAAIAIRSAKARLRVQRTCAVRSALVTVSGRSIRRVTILVDNRRVRTLTMRDGLRSVTVAVPLRRSGPARQTVRVHVTFRTGAAPRTLTARATRCARTAVGPQFTG